MEVSVCDFLSLVSSVGGIVTTSFYYVNHNIILGIVTEMFNPGMLGHGMGGTVLILMIVMFIIDRVR